MYLIISLLGLRAGYGIWLYQFLIIHYLFTFMELAKRLGWNIPTMQHPLWFPSVYTSIKSTNEPPHGKNNKMTVHPAMTQISLCIRPVWSESSLSTWMAGRAQLKFVMAECSKTQIGLTRHKWSLWKINCVKRIYVFEHSVMTNFNCAYPAIQRGRDLAFCLKVPLDSLLVLASNGGSGETARMRRLAWTFAARIGDKYQIRLTRPNSRKFWEMDLCHFPIRRRVTFTSTWDFYPNHSMCALPSFQVYLTFLRFTYVNYKRIYKQHTNNNGYGGYNVQFCLHIYVHVHTNRHFHKAS